jgi:hypothetical protein
MRSQTASRPQSCEVRNGHMHKVQASLDEGLQNLYAPVRSRPAPPISQLCDSSKIKEISKFERFP